MKLITNSKTLEKQFLRLLDKYSKYYWLTAWASSKSTSFDKLVRNKQRIKKIIVGIHFYQTHPDFIETFLDSKNVLLVDDVLTTGITALECARNLKNAGAKKSISTGTCKIKTVNRSFTIILKLLLLENVINRLTTLVKKSIINSRFFIYLGRYY